MIDFPTNQHFELSALNCREFPGFSLLYVNVSRRVIPPQLAHTTTMRLPKNSTVGDHIFIQVNVFIYNYMTQYILNKVVHQSVSKG